MELTKKNIHMNRWKTHASTQLTLDDDFIVPDTLDDAEQVILGTGDIQIESVRPQGEKVTVKGKWISRFFTERQAAAFRRWRALCLLKRQSMFRGWKTGIIRR